jgi:hypothetical protein
MLLINVYICVISDTLVTGWNKVCVYAQSLGDSNVTLLMRGCYFVKYVMVCCFVNGCQMQLSCVSRSCVDY